MGIQVAGQAGRRKFPRKFRKKRECLFRNEASPDIARLSRLTALSLGTRFPSFFSDIVTSSDHAIWSLPESTNDISEFSQPFWQLWSLEAWHFSLTMFLMSSLFLDTHIVSAAVRWRLFLVASSFGISFDWNLLLLSSPDISFSKHPILFTFFLTHVHPFVFTPFLFETCFCQNCPPLRLSCVLRWIFILIPFSWHLFLLVSYNQVCREYFQVLLRSTKFAPSASQFCFVVQDFHKLLPTITSP